MVLIQVVSDLHLETHPAYRDYDLPVTAPHLALLGDIGHICDDAFLKWLEVILSHYQTIFFCLGNHEPYHMRMSSAKKRMRAFAVNMEKLRGTRAIGRFVLLDRTRYDMSDSPESGGVTILGCTLFSRVSQNQAREVASRFIDFKDIVDWDVGDHNDCHELDVDWLDSEVEKISRESPDRTIVIFTHHSPSVDQRTRNPRFKKSSVDSGFMTDLSRHVCWTAPSVKVWAFGHTHYNFDFVDEATSKRVLANQKGYCATLPSSGKADAGLPFQPMKTVYVQPEDRS